MRVYGYIRVSSDWQAESGLSLEDQTAVITRRAKLLCAERGLKIGTILSDAGVSASRYELRKRPEGRHLDELLLRGDHVIIAKLDRAFRSQRDCLNTIEAWERRQVVVHLLDISVETATPTGRLFIGILSAIAQWESARIGERIRDAMRAMRVRGLSVNGQAKLGWTLRKKHLVANAADRRLARRIKRLRERGHTWRAIAERLNAEHVKRPKRHLRQRFTTWNAQACARMYAAVIRGW